ncbi:glycoside hydrolase family 30 protein [Dothistroma septosporum NZE10]|uniref:Glycoside hydrolase family 30 protein n=1 Tax=Dothistroma septosporum (strain NZE10 / CBS 128990) TaxID=675120 RepID=N1Q2X9_DOTSN|nr:glycoside hydrolase family 30 protein [Dothistroma septosporum NZE10]
MIEVDSLHGARQEMVGFGFSWTDSTVHNFNRLEPEVLDTVMEELFGPHPRGNNMGMMRHTIGSSDMSGNQYSLDDNGPSFNEGQPDDPGLSHFTLTGDGEAMVKLIAKMGSHKSDVLLTGAPWSFPGWMKHNGLFIAPRLNTDTSYNILNNSFDAQYIPHIIRYFTKYIDAYAEHGVTVNGLSLMNEPLNYQGGYPCMFLDASDAAAILNRGLGAALKERNVALLTYDHNTDQGAYPSQVIQRAPGMVQAASWHCYAYLANYTVMSDFRQAYPETPQFMTECSTYLPTTLGLDWGVVNAFLPSVQNGGSGATMWVLATDPDFGPHAPWGGCAGCQGAIIVNSSTEYLKTNDYYMVGQFSRFIRRGGRNYEVVKGNEGDHLSPNQFNTIAIQNPDKSWAVVFVNNMNRTESIRLSFTGSGHIWEGDVPNSTVTTWLLPSDEMIRKNNTDVMKPYPFTHANRTNSTAPGRKRTETCALRPVTTVSSSSATTSTAPLLPVPYATHFVQQNLLSERSGRSECEPENNILVRDMMQSHRARHGRHW